MNILRESMTRHFSSPYTIRVWRQEELGGKVDNSDLREAITAAHKKVGGPFEIAKAVLAVPRVNAVEVLLPYGDGEVLYRDWP
jgi:hypothetical protein